MAVHERTFGEGQALHWRRWLELADAGRLDKEFDRMVFDEDQIAELRQDGVIRSVAEILTERMTAA